MTEVFFPLLMHYKRDLITGNSFLWSLFIFIMTWHEKTAPVFTYNSFNVGLVKFHSG